MPDNPPSDEDSCKTIIDFLMSNGWIDSAYFRDPEDAQPGLGRFCLTEDGINLIASLDRIQDFIRKCDVRQKKGFFDIADRLTEDAKRKWPERFR
jgi:hypothetical protein